jgi:hypothetical protein
MTLDLPCSRKYGTGKRRARLSGVAGYDNVGARSGQPQRHGKSNAATTACYENGLAVQLAPACHSSTSLSLIIALWRLESHPGYFPLSKSSIHWQDTMYSE